MKISLRNIYSTATGNKLEMAWLDDLLTVRETVFSPYEVTKHKIKEYRFLQNGQFRTGLLNYVIREAGDDLDFEITDLRPAYDAVMYLGLVPLQLPDPEKGKIILREDQLTSARALIEFQRGIIELPPGAGKTEVAIAALLALDKQERFAVFVHTDTLYYQWFNRLQARGISRTEIGSISSLRWEPNRITVAMTPTLASRLERLATVEFLNNLTGFVADECHISGNPTNEQVLCETPNARFRWGLSATPLEYNTSRNLKLIGLIGDPLHIVQIEELIERGEIADILYHFLPRPLQSFYGKKILSQVEEHFESWQDYYNFYLHRNPFVRHLIWRICEHHSDKSSLIVVNRIEHGCYLEESIPNSVFVHGQTPEKERRQALVDFRAGRIHVLISSPVLDFGIDLPDLRVVILAGGMESPLRLIQRIGRGLRKKLLDNLLHVYDFNFKDIPYLGDHSQSRIETMKDRCPNLRITSSL